MKKIALLIISLAIINITLFANTPDITGQWLLTKAVFGGNSDEVYQTLNFRADGNAEMQGRIFGSWKADIGNNTFTIKSEMIKEFSTIWDITKFTDKELVLKSEKGTLFFTDYNQENIKKENMTSGLTGIWELNDKNDRSGKYFINFQEPDNFIIKYVDSGYTSTSRGAWIYNSKEKFVVIITSGHLLRGLNTVVSVSDSRLTLENKEMRLTGKRLEPKGNTRTRLDSDSKFCNPDSSTEQIGYDNFSWFDIEIRTSYLKNITELKYRRSVFMDEFNAFTTDELSARVNWTEDSISIDNIFRNLPKGEYTENNIFYPLEEPFIYYTIGIEEITVPAGTFKCMVIDTNSYSSGNKTRLYMIENRPGVYAKIINIEDKYDGELYTMFELESIEGNFISQSNKQVIGEWLLTEIISGGIINDTSINFEFINDGRLAVNQSGSNDFFNWKEIGKNIILDFGDGEQYFTISKLTDNELKLEGPELGYNFIKMNTSENSSEDSRLTAYWMLINTSDPYSLMHLTEDHSVFDIDGISRLPIEGNHSEMVGKWMYDSTGENLVFNTDEYEALCSGSFKVVKLNNELLVIGRESYRLVFTKIDPEKNIQNNTDSGLIGLWKITDRNGKINFYDFRDPLLFRKGSSKEEMPKKGLWFYNPENKNLFLGYMMNQLEGFSVISEISGNSIIFENGLKAERVR